MTDGKEIRSENKNLVSIKFFERLPERDFLDTQFHYLLVTFPFCEVMRIQEQQVSTPPTKSSHENISSCSTAPKIPSYFKASEG